MGQEAGRGAVPVVSGSAGERLVGKIQGDGIARDGDSADQRAVVGIDDGLIAVVVIEAGPAEVSGLGVLRNGPWIRGADGDVGGAEITAGGGVPAANAEVVHGAGLEGARIPLPISGFVCGPTADDKRARGAARNVAVAVVSIGARKQSGIHIVDQRSEIGAFGNFDRAGGFSRGVIAHGGLNIGGTEHLDVRNGAAREPGKQEEKTRKP